MLHSQPRVARESEDEPQVGRGHGLAVLVVALLCRRQGLVRVKVRVRVRVRSGVRAGVGLGLLRLGGGFVKLRLACMPSSMALGSWWRAVCAAASCERKRVPG